MMEDNQLSVISDQVLVIDLVIEDIYTEFGAEALPIAQVHQILMQDVQTSQKANTRQGG